MARDKKTIKFNPLDKVYETPVADLSPQPPKKSPAKASSKPNPKIASAPTKNPKPSALKPLPKVSPKPATKAAAKVSIQPSKGPTLAKSIDLDKQGAFQVLDGFVDYSQPTSTGWKTAALQYDAQTHDFGFMTDESHFVRFTANKLNGRQKGGSIVPKALIGLVLGGGVGFALSYLLSKSPEKYTYFQLQNEASSTLYLRLDSKSLSYII